MAESKKFCMGSQESWVTAHRSPSSCCVALGKSLLWFSLYPLCHRWLVWHWKLWSWRKFLPTRIDPIDHGAAFNVPLAPSWNLQLIVILGMDDEGGTFKWKPCSCYLCGFDYKMLSFFTPPPHKPPMGSSISLFFQIGSFFPYLMSGIRLKCIPMHFSPIWQVS